MTPSTIWFVYALQSKADKRFYIGTTNNVWRRLAEHHRGKTASTAHRLPAELVYFEGHTNKLDARRRERYFKTSKGKTTLRQMLRSALSTGEKDSL